MGGEINAQVGAVGGFEVLQPQKTGAVGQAVDDGLPAALVERIPVPEVSGLDLGCGRRGAGLRKCFLDRPVDKERGEQLPGAGRARKPLRPRARKRDGRYAQDNEEGAADHPDAQPLLLPQE